MHQYANYLDALSEHMYPQQSHATSPFLSSASQPPSLSASPVSSDGSDSLIEEDFQCSLFGYDQSPTAIYSSYDQKYVGCRYHVHTPADQASLFSSANFIVGSTPVNDSSSLGATAKHEYSLGYDSHMMFNRDFSPSAPTYVSSLGGMAVDSAPFPTVAPSATSGLFDEEVSAFKLSAGIEELSISSPASSPFFYVESVGSSPHLLPMLEPEPIQACDPRVLGSPMAIQQSVIQSGSSMQVDGPRRTGASSHHEPAVDSDYSPSGESEVEDENDHDYGMPLNKKKNRSARVTSAAHPYLKPASKAKHKKSHGAKLDIPVPVPGLTKNSRGRSVPKKTEDVYEYVPVTRSFWCSVENCDKLFSRGEHLKRHITSIHTHDKRE